MKFVSMIILLLISASAFAVEPDPGKVLTAQEKELSTECNLEARNSLVSGDVALAEKVCTQAIKEIEKAHADKEFLVDPIMNLAFSFTLAGQFDKATPLYTRARNIREKLYGADSKKVKEIDDMVRNQDELKRQPKK